MTLQNASVLWGFGTQTPKAKHRAGHSRCQRKRRGRLGPGLLSGDLTSWPSSLPGHQLVPLERPRVLHPLRGNEDAPLQPPAPGGEEAAVLALLSRVRHPCVFVTPGEGGVAAPRIAARPERWEEGGQQGSAGNQLLVVPAALGLTWSALPPPQPPSLAPLPPRRRGSCFLKTPNHRPVVESGRYGDGHVPSPLALPRRRPPLPGMCPCHCPPPHPREASTRESCGRRPSGAARPCPIASPRLVHRPRVSPPTLLPSGPGTAPEQWPPIQPPRSLCPPPTPRPHNPRHCF